MKKIILINDEEDLKIKYTISRRNLALYFYNKISYRKFLIFYKYNKSHRYCDSGPQYISKYHINYRENNQYHNLYGYAYINKTDNVMLYFINDIHYKKDQFLKYISIYNNLSYKRTYL